MKVQNKSSFITTGAYTIERKDGEKITIPIRAVGPKYEVGIADELPPPQPPHVYARNSKGQIIRDAAGKPQKVHDEADPAYLAKAKRLNVLSLVAYIYAGTITGPDFEWTTKRGAENAETFYAAILDEMEEFGLSQGDIRDWWQEIATISRLLPEEVTEARDSFQE